MDRKYNIIADNAAESYARRIGGQFTEEKLVAASNKGTCKRALKDIEVCEIKLEASENFLKVILLDAEISMCGELASCKCSCPSKTICRHIIAAAIAVSVFSDGDEDCVEENAETDIPKPSAQDKQTSEEIKADEKYLDEVMKTMTGILSKGIISCTKNDSEILSRLSLTAPTVHRKIGRLCRSAAEDIELMLEKIAGFNQLTAAMRICRIYNTAVASLKEQGKALLFSGNEYENIGRRDFICLGVYPYKSKSGFAGLTAVMFEREQNKFYTYNSAISDICSKTSDSGSLKSLYKLMRAHSHWQNNMSIENISGRRLSLVGCKADSNDKISSSSQTTCVTSNKIGCNDLPEEAFEFASEEEYDYFSYQKKPRYAVVSAESIDAYFDKGEQILYYSIIGKDGKFNCETAYSELTSLAVKSIEAYADKPAADRYFLLKRMGGITEAIAEINSEGIVNIYFGNGKELTI